MARKIDDKTRLRVRTAYVVLGHSFEECSEEFGVGVRTVKDWASKEGWTRERRRISTDGAEVVQDELRSAVAADLDAHRRVSDRMVSVADKVLDELESLCRQIPSEFQRISGNATGQEALKYLLARAKMLRSLVETGAKLDQWTAGSIETGRLVRGIREGIPSVPEPEKDFGVGSDEVGMIFEHHVFEGESEAATRERA